MVNEAKLKTAFGKVKEDTEGIKNELAFALRRIAKIEEMLTKQEVLGNNTTSKKKR
ncbi:MAG: hypothetical protein Q8L27_01870 [archaeon]|nr:hypothetical protein [archaeon]